jgi:hypothetical protein
MQLVLFGAFLMIWIKEDLFMLLLIEPLLLSFF